jgi:hypothetical protein
MELDQDAGEGIDVWMSANTLAELGTLTARWLEGSLTAHPGLSAHGCEGTPDEETTDLIPVLARLNRAGFVTDNSQPGEDDDGWIQRACVSGYCSEQTAETIAAVCMPTDLVCLVSWPGMVSYLNVPVSLDRGKANTWEGLSRDEDNIYDEWGTRCSTLAVAALVGACQVSVIDPIWGRNDLLWPTVDRALAGPPLTGAFTPNTD